MILTEAEAAKAAALEATRKAEAEAARSAELEARRFLAHEQAREEQQRARKAQALAALELQVRSVASGSRV